MEQLQLRDEVKKLHEGIEAEGCHVLLWQWKKCISNQQKIISEYKEHTTMDSGQRADPRQQQGTQMRRVPKDCTTPRDGKEALQWV